MSEDDLSHYMNATMRWRKKYEEAQKENSRLRKKLATAIDMVMKTAQRRPMSAEIGDDLHSLTIVLGSYEDDIRLVYVELQQERQNEAPDA